MSAFLGRIGLDRPIAPRIAWRCGYQARPGASKAFGRTAPFKSCSAARCATSADRSLLRECWLLLTNRGAYRASREELTPVRWDWLSAIPLIVAALWLLVRPAAAYDLPKKGWGLPSPQSRKAFAKFEPWALMGRQGRKHYPCIGNEHAMENSSSPSRDGKVIESPVSCCAACVRLWPHFDRSRRCANSTDVGGKADIARAGDASSLTLTRHTLLPPSLW